MRPTATPTLLPTFPTARFLVTVSALALWAAGAAAQSYPTKPVTLIVPNPPGGVVDTSARLLSEPLAKLLGQPVVVENKGGASGNIAYQQVAGAAKDGYTLLISYSAYHVGNPALFTKLPWAQKDFVPVALLTAATNVIAAHPSVPANTLKEFITYAKANPGKLNFGSSGNYGTMHVPMEMLKARAGIFMTHIPYTGAGPALLALLGGQVDAVASGPSTVAQNIKAGKLRALAHWGDKPLQSLPDVPSLKQAGYPVAFAQWSALFVPAGAPDDIVQKLRAASRKVAQDPHVVGIINKAGSPIEYLDAPEFQTYWDADATIMVDAVRRIGKVE